MKMLIYSLKGDVIKFGALGPPCVHFFQEIGAKAQPEKKQSCLSTT